MAAAHRTVLVVEDEVLIRFLMADALVDAGFVVIEAGNVHEALAVLGANADIDALVTDVDMPGALNGLDLVRMVAATARPVEMVVSSGRAGLREQVPAFAACFGKPARHEDIAVYLLGRFAVGEKLAA